MGIIKGKGSIIGYEDLVFINLHVHCKSLTFDAYLIYNYDSNVSLFFFYMLMLNATIVGILLRTSIIWHKVQKQNYDKHIQYNLLYEYIVFRGKILCISGYIICGYPLSVRNDSPTTVRVV